MIKKVKRLYEQFQPKNYNLQIELDPDELEFSGTVIISGKKVGRPSKRITLHQKDLRITSANIMRHDKKGDQAVEVARINAHKNYDEIRLHANQLLYPGEYTVEIQFSGKITDPMHGLYPCYYKKDGVKKHLLATQFESHHAREVFPCIDEPEAKATFDLHLNTPEDLVVLSNTPAMKQEVKDGRKETTFGTTPVMSTYLLAFVAGDIHCVEGMTKDGVEVRSWATSVQPKPHLEYANKEAIDVLEFFVDYFQTPFPLKKIDQVALPDFESLAMENWGLITYREVGLLSDPDNRSLSGEQLITMVIAHELSHQWFGNLVTMKWWDDLWLNESFASVMETLAPDRLHPDWHAWEDFASGRVISAAVRDVYKDVQPVGVNVKHPDEIHSLFDPSIVYAKGARLLKMLYEHIGEKDFSTALKNYFKKYAFDNAERKGLWDELSQASGQDIHALMNPWIEQSGTPMVTVKRRNNVLNLEQSRFLLDGEDKISIWPIPLLADKKFKAKLLDQKSVQIPLNDDEDLLLNVDGYAHFITKYVDNATRENLNKKIIDRSINASGRIVALNDMILLSQKGEHSLVDVLELVSHCGREDRDAVWSVFSRALGCALILADGDEKVEEQLRAYRRQLTAYWYKELGWDDKPSDDPNTKHLRTTALSMTLGGEDEQAIKHALNKFKKAKSVESLPAEQRAMIAATAAKFGKSNDVDRLMKEYESVQRSDVQDSITAGLCATRHAATAQKIIDWGLSNNGVVRPQDILHWFAYMMRNRHTRPAIWEWLTSDWEGVTRKLGGSKSLDYVVRYASGPISSKDWQTKYNNFFEPKKKIALLERNINIATNEINARVAWRNRDLPKLKDFFYN